MMRRYCRMKELLVIFLSLIISGTVLLLHHDSFIQLNTDFSTNHHEDNGEFVCRCDSENIDISKVCVSKIGILPLGTIQILCNKGRGRGVGQMIML